MYEIDTVRSYIIDYYNYGEADRKYRILTPDLGVVLVSARSVRKESSKLKYILRKYNLVDLDLVSSRGGYQVTGGVTHQTLSDELSFQSLAVLEVVGGLIGRLSQGSEYHSSLFAVYQALAVVLLNLDSSSDPIPDYYYHAVELWSSAQILHEFGYFDFSFSPDINPNIFTKTNLEQADFVLLDSHRALVARKIKEGLDQSML